MTYLQNGELSRILAESSLIIFTKSRLNLKPEKLHSEGKANKLYASPASGKWNQIKFMYVIMNSPENISKQNCYL